MLRILTFNIRTGRDLTDRLDLGRTADVIAAAEPDVVGLQEVDRHFAERSEFRDQSVRLAQRLGWAYGFAPALDRDPEAGRTERRQFGNAILTPHALAGFSAHLLTNLPSQDRGLETRAAARAQIQIGDRTVIAINTHLDHRSGQQRGHQASQVNRLVDDSDEPTIVMGDLNAGKETPEVHTIASGLTDAAGALTLEQGLTFPSEVPRVALDHIFVRGLRPVRAAVLNVRASDHRPLLAEVDWIE